MKALLKQACASLLLIPCGSQAKREVMAQGEVCTPRASLNPLAVRLSKFWKLASQGIARDEQQPSLGARLCTPRVPFPRMMRSGSSRGGERIGSSSTSRSNKELSISTGGKGNPLHTLACTWDPVRDISGNALYRTVPFNCTHGRSASEASWPTCWACTPDHPAGALPLMASASVLTRFATNSHSSIIAL